MTSPESFESDFVAHVEALLRQELEFKGRVLAASRFIEDLELDSIGLTVLAVGVENRYRIRLSEEDAASVTTVAELAALVRLRAQEAA